MKRAAIIILYGTTLVFGSFAADLIKTADGPVQTSPDSRPAVRSRGASSLQAVLTLPAAPADHFLISGK